LEIGNLHCTTAGASAHRSLRRGKLDDALLGALKFIAGSALRLSGGLQLLTPMDRSNISFASVPMNADLRFSAAVYGLGAGLFFVGYAIFEVPSNLLLARFGRDAGSPASCLSLKWYPNRWRGRAVSRFYIAAPLGTVLMGAVAGALLGLDGWMGLKSWQWLFLLIEGLGGHSSATVKPICPDSCNHPPIVKGVGRMRTNLFTKSISCMNETVWTANRRVRTVTVGRRCTGCDTLRLANFVGRSEWIIQFSMRRPLCAKV
jgi:hypothetical protein